MPRSSNKLLESLSTDDFDLRVEPPQLPASGLFGVPSRGSCRACVRPRERPRHLIISNSAPHCILITYADLWSGQ
jgi:hypothetical protein